MHCYYQHRNWQSQNKRAHQGCSQDLSFSTAPVMGGAAVSGHSEWAPEILGSGSLKDFLAFLKTAASSSAMI